MHFKLYIIIGGLGMDDKTIKAEMINAILSNPNTITYPATNGELHVMCKDSLVNIPLDKFVDQVCKAADLIK